MKNLLLIGALTLIFSNQPAPAETAAAIDSPRPDSAPASDAPAKPLTSIIGADAEITIDPRAVLLGRLQGLVIEVHNGTDRPLLFDGDRAVATIGNAHYQSAPLSAIDNTAHPARTSTQRFGRAVRDTVVAGVTIGAYPAVHDIKIQSGPILKRYGWDEARREDEITRFGKRILWPGDTSKGVVYFSTNAVLKGASVEMPVNSIYDTADQASIKTSP